ncbi:methyltransferase domain-containing protein [Streptomyces sp. NBC_00513]|uniref:protein-L-isoaspartate O-methyltransferase family protein n=1 Tax=unclassified Streptomyces TaxID=2593676 RepID=UPI002254243C|nr:methyltransferase domain-containing protein [Streptomyces sp. NBC_00424]MCX5070956.1 methyltransferase domain-containing protein [Streptomyces sp. NBC_00424]WUD45606.1 methyltransferase domain-containing protein [Streptomyces sp. NBC_00513]
MATLPSQNIAAAGETPVDTLLTAVTEQLDQALPTRLERAFRRVDRHRFLPERIWLRDGSGGYAPVDRVTDPDRWMTAAYADQPLVTRFTDGLPTSSASMPSMVARMLLLTGLAEPSSADGNAGTRALELGAGTGYNAGLLCALVGDRRVTTVELDPVLAAEAQENLKAAGYTPTVVIGDAADSRPPGGPWDVLLATFSVDHIPPTWLTQIRAGGRIVTPWTSAWCTYGTLALTAPQHGHGEGRFHSFASFMPMARPETRPDEAAPASATHEGGVVRSSTTLSPWAVAGGDLDAEFHVGLTVAGASFAWDTSGEHAHTRLQVTDTTGSWATVDYDGRTSAVFAVAQAGARHLWDEVTTAHQRWEQLGRPHIDRYGLTTTGQNTTVWVDSPAIAVAAF